MGTSVERGAGSAFLASGRPQSVRDALHGSVRLSGWAVALLATPPFRRLAGISLSDVPGELLFGRPFPSRLDHAIGVYSLARLARPRDRALQAAALAHDLGHGPLSHLTEPLMRERLGIAHEERSAVLLGDVRAAVSSLSSSARAQLDWIDWNEVAALVLGKERGALLNGRLDYDNADNVARFLLASELGVPEYDPRALVAGLRLARAHTGTNTEAQRVYLSAEAEPAARAWQRDRARVYAYLHAGHRNLALHAMLRKAVDLGAATGILPSDFFDLTDRQALRLLGSALDRGLAELVRDAQAGAAYICVWEAVVEGAGANPPVEALVAGWRERLALEAHLAAESALPAAAVVSDLLTSSASRALPPIGTPGDERGDERSAASDAQAASDAPATPAMLRLFAPASTGRDYLRRMRLAAERCFMPLGVVPVAVEP